jgi:hypothetical protein
MENYRLAQATPRVLPAIDSASFFRDDTPSRFLFFGHDLGRIRSSAGGGG